MSKPMNGDLRVWHIPQIPGAPFHVRVASFEEADLVLRVLAEYDLFQLHHRIKPDYCNVQGVELYDAEDVDDGWWESVDDDWFDPDDPLARPAPPTDYSDRFDLEANRTNRGI